MKMRKVFNLFFLGTLLLCVSCSSVDKCSEDEQFLEQENSHLRDSALSYNIKGLKEFLNVADFLSMAEDEELAEQNSEIKGAFERAFLILNSITDSCVYEEGLADYYKAVSHTFYGLSYLESFLATRTREADGYVGKDVSLYFLNCQLPIKAYNYHHIEGSQLKSLSEYEFMALNGLVYFFITEDMDDSVE